jgi:hypothetical protein
MPDVLIEVRGNWLKGRKADVNFGFKVGLAEFKKSKHYGK